MDSKETPSSTTSRSDQAKNEIEKQSKSQIDKNDRDSDGKTLDKKLTPSTSSQNEDLLNSEINAAHEKDEKEKPSNETNKNESLKAYDETKTTKKTKGTISEEKSVKKTTKESDRVKNHFKEDYISPIGESVVRLNDVIWKKIFAYLDPITIFRCTCVCKYWQRIATQITITSLEINMRHYTLTDSHLKKICQQCGTLTLLSITSCSKVTGKGLRYISKYLSKLSTLYLDSVASIHNEELKYITRISTLTQLQIARSMHIGDSAMQYICTLSNLVKLDLSGCVSLRNKGISLVTTLTNLTYLNISSCPELDNEALNPIILLPKLKTLLLNWNNINNDGVKILTLQKISLSPTTEKRQQNATGFRGLEQTLQCLYLLGTEISSSGVKILCKQFTNLRELSLAWCPTVRDRSLKYLTCLKSLQMLDLENTAITKAILTVLIELPQLKLLNISHTEVTSEDQKHLREMYPNINLVESFLP